MGNVAMMRVRLKADGRIVEILPDGAEKTIDHSDPAQFVRHVRARCGLTQAAFAEKIEVPLENSDLRFARRVHVVVVESALADGNDAWIRRQPLDLRERRVIAVLRFVRMKTDRRPNITIFRTNFYRFRRVVEFRPRHHESANVLLASSHECGIGVRHRQMAMRIGETRQTRSTIIDRPIPPEMQSVARPIDLSCDFSA